MVWTTPEAVNSVTGKTATAEQIEQAVAVLEVITGWDLTTPTDYSSRARRMITLAVIYQTAYMVTNGGVMTEREFASKAVGDVSISKGSSTSGERLDALAPLARVALRKVIGAKQKTRTQNIGRLENTVGIDALIESNDPATGWTRT